MLRIKGGKIISAFIVLSVLGLAIHCVIANSISRAEARDLNDSGRIVLKGIYRSAGNTYLSPPPVPHISVSPENYDWGNLWVGFSDAEEVTITNGGTDILNISDITLSDTENFTFIANAGNYPCGDVPITIEAGTSCTCHIKFNPQSEAAYSATLSIDSDDPDTPTAEIALTGTGVPNDFPFGDVNFSTNIDSGCSIVNPGGDITDGLGAYGLLILAASWFGVWRRREEWATSLFKIRLRDGVRTVVLGLAATFLLSCAMGHHHSVLIKGAPISYVEAGEGGPTVVFEAGLGDGFRTWEPVFSDVAGFTRAVAYSRAGYAGNIYHFDKEGRRSADDVARMLRALLDKRGIPGPYVLVGHSIGGNYALRFAKMFPGEVMGIVLVDSRPRKFTGECENAGLDPCGPSKIHALIMPPHVAAEIRGLPMSEEKTPTPKELGGLPVTVMAATEPPKRIPRGMQDIWLRLQKEFALEVENGRYVQADGSGHYIHRDAPALVVGEIRSMVERVRSREPGS